jgi:hypothetical protein
MKWMKQSGPKINEEQTEIFLFYKQDVAPLIVRIGGIVMNTKDSINMLGAILDPEMSWSKRLVTFSFIIKKPQY